MQLLVPEDFDNKKKPRHKTYQYVPSHWNIYKVEQKDFGSTGFATFRLKVKIADTTQNYSLNLLTISNACKVFVNGALLTEIGKVGKRKSTSYPKYSPRVVSIPSIAEDLEIILQVSNFHQDRGGVLRKIELGLDKELRAAKRLNIRLESFFWGAFVFMGIYFVGLFVGRQKDNYPSLFFGLCCLSISIRLMGMGEVYAQNLGWHTVIHFEYGSFFMMPVFTVFMLWTLFPKDYYKPILYFFLAIYAVLNIIFVFTPPLFFTKFLVFTQIVLILLLSYLIFGIARAYRYKRESSALIFFAFILVLLAVIHDILYGSGVFISFHLLPWSLFVLCIIQSINLSYRFFAILKTNEELSLELKSTNQNLEKIVEVRTSKLEQRNRELAKREQEVRTQYKELQSVTEEITKQNKIIEEQRNRSDLLYKKINDSIKAAEQIQQAILPTPEIMQTLLPEHFVVYEPKDIVSGDFYWIERIDNKILLAVMDCTGHGVPGAFMTLIGSDALDSIVLQQHITSPAEILNHLHYEVRTKLRQAETESQEGMDASVILMEDNGKDRVRITFSGAKNGFYLVSKAQGEAKIERIRGHRTGIAGNQIMTTKFENQVFEFEKESMIYVGTDGYEDQNDKERRKFSRQRLQSLFLRISAFDMNKQKLEMEKVLKEYMQGTTQRDDILWVGLKL